VCQLPVNDADGQSSQQDAQAASGCQQRRCRFELSAAAAAKEMLEVDVVVVEISLQEFVNIPTVVLLSVRRSQ
jgi:hypothetical protein